MRNYLIDFLQEFGYSERDKAALVEAFDKICSSEGALAPMQQALELYAAEHADPFANLLRLADRSAELAGLNVYTAELLLLILMTAPLRVFYRREGIPDGIYANTVADLSYKLEECRLVYGVVGTFVAEWFEGFFKLSRFALGRLQFEVVRLGVDYNKDGISLTADSPVINIHIPRSGEPLTEEACRMAYAMAKEFFKDRVTADPCPFVCNSYLLYPENEKFLPKHGNTYRFFKSFKIIEAKPKKGLNDLWRIFDTKETNLDKLPADTSLRRAIIDHLRRGGRMGTGLGIFFL